MLWGIYHCSGLKSNLFIKKTKIFKDDTCYLESILQVSCRDPRLYRHLIKIKAKSPGYGMT